MEDRSLYDATVKYHNQYPIHKHDLSGADFERRGLNPTCGDDITLKLKIKNGVIEDGAFSGNGCAISQASADMMLDLVIGKPVEEAKRLSEIFRRMITGKVTDEELETLEEASVLLGVSQKPMRAKCATLAWHTMEIILDAGDV